MNASSLGLKRPAFGLVRAEDAGFEPARGYQPQHCGAEGDGCDGVTRPCGIYAPSLRTPGAREQGLPRVIVRHRDGRSRE